LLSLCDVFGCDLTFGLPQSKSRDLRRAGFRQFTVATRFDTLWAMKGHSPVSSTGRSAVGYAQQTAIRFAKLTVAFSAIAAVRFTTCDGGGKGNLFPSFRPVEFVDPIWSLSTKLNAR
jgi:hypothetical protein